ncbi:MAG: hypothetical protein QW244_01205 [Candidatus Pacearchaeota archaeon]
MKKTEERREAVKRIEESKKLLDEIRKLMGKFDWTVNKKTLKKVKESYSLKSWENIKEKAEKYFHEIDQYLTPEISKIDPGYYKLLAKTKESLYKIIVYE